MALMDGVLSEVRAANMLIGAQSAEQQELKALLQRVLHELDEMKKPRLEEPVYMSTKQAAKRYGICEDIVAEITKMPEAPDTLKVGQRRLLPIASYDAFMEGQFADSTWSGRRP